ncbi:hypothetical protein DICVIV_13577 [Dictyocaulus viviparus]|uniref:Uncharacterized protein n=1 Tax=Dictyocaulus viviparus TaxID=29172 RepID=A0A0D8X7E1_DICVI|nr:hypothetical protein DICVIV_13577 [Dictyocaulus viviparus]
MANGDCDMPNDIKEVPAQHRTISGSFTVMWFTNICEKTAIGQCNMPNDIKEVPAQHRVISGSFTAMWFPATGVTTNVIMANWSTQMRQSILNRVMRSLWSGAFSTNFIGATDMMKPIP